MGLVWSVDSSPYVLHNHVAMGPNGGIAALPGHGRQPLLCQPESKPTAVRSAPDSLVEIWPPGQVEWPEVVLIGVLWAGESR
jgi:hypothetical protein